MSGGTWPSCGCSSASRVAAGPPSTSFNSSRAVDWMMSLARATSRDAGQLHEQLIAVVAVLRDVRLRHAELVHAALDRVVRLHHRLLAQAAAMFGRIVKS